MDQRAQDEVYPLQLLLEAAEDQADDHEALSNCVVAAAPQLNIPFHYSNFVQTMLRFARAHETSPGQYPNFDVRCFGFCLMHPSGSQLVRTFIDIILGRTPMAFTPPDKKYELPESLDNVDPAKIGLHAIFIPDEDEDDETLPETERTAARDRREARLRKAQAIDPTALRQLEHNLAMEFTRDYTFVHDVRMRKMASTTADDEPASAGQVDWELEGFASKQASGHKRVAPKPTRAAELKVLVAQGKLPKLRRGASPPPITARRRESEVLEKDSLYETRAIEVHSVSESGMVEQIQANHDALRHLIQLALDRTGVRLPTGVLIRTALTQFINATHISPAMSLFEVCLRSVLPPIPDVAARVAEIERKRREQQQQARAKDASKSDSSKPAPSASAGAAVDCGCQTAPLPTKVRVVYVDRPHENRHTPSPAPNKQTTRTSKAAGAKDREQQNERESSPPQKQATPRADDKQQPAARDEDDSPRKEATPRRHDDDKPASPRDESPPKQPTPRDDKPATPRDDSPQKQSTPRDGKKQPTPRDDSPQQARDQSPQKQATPRDEKPHSSPDSSPQQQPTPRDDKPHSSPDNSPQQQPTRDDSPSKARDDSPQKQPSPRDESPQKARDSSSSPQKQPAPRDDDEAPAALDTVAQPAPADAWFEEEETRQQHKDSDRPRPSTKPDSAQNVRERRPVEAAKPQPARRRPVPVAAATEDVDPALQPLLHDLAAKYQVAHGVSVPKPTRRAKSSLSQTSGDPYKHSVDVALGLRKTKAAQRRDADRKQAAAEEAFLHSNSAQKMLLPPVSKTPQFKANGPHHALSAPVQRTRQPPKTLAPRQQRGTTVGGVPFERLPRDEQRKVIASLAQALADQEHTLQRGTSPNRADTHRQAADRRRREEDRDFQNFVSEERGRANFGEQANPRHV